MDTTESKAGATPCAIERRALRPEAFGLTKDGGCRTLTYYIAPGTGGPERQCHIYEHSGLVSGWAARQHYARHPDQWREVGLRNAAGRVVRFSGAASAYAEMRRHEPLLAGAVWTVEGDKR